MNAITTEIATSLLSIQPEPRKESLSQSANVLKRFENDVESAGLIRERENAKIVFLAAVSAALPRPLNVSVHGSSSAGKNCLTGTVAKFIPDERKKMLSGMSPKTLMHSAEDEYQHKAVFIAEYEGVGGADYAIRTMQSERIIEWEFVTQAKDAGLVKKRNTVKGPAAFIQATTRATLHPENETRLLFVEVDESEEQTHAINERQAQAAAGQIKTASPEMFAEWHEFVSSLVPSEVLVPFAPELVPHFPSVRVRSRRDFPKLLGLVECSAFLHQHIRDRDEKNRIVAHPDDYAIAKELFEHCYYAGPEKDVALLLKAVEKLRAFFTHGDKTFAVSDIMKELRWGQTKAYQILNRALEVGCIADGDRRGQYRYIRGTTDSLLQLPTTVCRGTRDFS